ncbi:tRNA wybutosine-synthesizing protein 2 homolog isoform X1 [Strix uralensis]|uniref:tRNA wybutosine-synthesizing protein 2 homolog isoform X1 n=1 Tax=Strix uralensis TaxID=36305 RepID=UPI003DA4727B
MVVPGTPTGPGSLLSLVSPSPRARLPAGDVPPSWGLAGWRPRTSPSLSLRWPRSCGSPSASGSIWKKSSSWMGATGCRRCRGVAWPCPCWRRSCPSCGCPGRCPVGWSGSRAARRQTPAQKLRDQLRRLLGQSWSEELERDVPRAWQRHGDLVLLSEDSFRAAPWEKLGPALWEAVASALGAQRVARRGRVLPDGIRSPSVTLLLGQDGWVEHVDNGIRYTFDVTKCMFSPGNITEKLRVASLPCSGEVLVDLYAASGLVPTQSQTDSESWGGSPHPALPPGRTVNPRQCLDPALSRCLLLPPGIGYFTLPYLVHAAAAFAHACEWNGHAVEALRRNLELNGVRDRCRVHHGDSRQLELRDVADRVNLGLIPSSEEGWPVACRVLKKDTGGVLHIHHNVESLPALAPPQLQAERGSPEAQHPTEDCGKGTPGVRIRPEWQRWAEAVAARIQGLLAELHGQLWHTSILHIQAVKSYAPHVHHLVLDLECRPTPPA